MIVGGWEYIGAAYALVWIVLAGYAVSLIVRYRRAAGKS
ncbi:MAG: CcmD family protein [Deltaproteobacteria bacterium]|nr:CcmD family protein [Deltaproteobacteria bacterium]